MGTSGYKTYRFRCFPMPHQHKRPPKIGSFCVLIFGSVFWLVLGSGSASSREKSVVWSFGGTLICVLACFLAIFGLFCG